MDDFAKVLGGFLVVVGVLALVFAAVAVAAVLTLLFVGFMSVHIAKSTRALVQEEASGPALCMAFAWAGVLTVGCLLGSIGLVGCLAAALGTPLDAVLQRAYGGMITIGGRASVGEVTFRAVWTTIEQWILGGAYLFFAKASLLLYLANRIYLARKRSGNAWLGVVPPLAGLAVFFVVDHWGLIQNALTHPTAETVSAVFRTLWEGLYRPIDLAIKAFTTPDAVLAWARSELLQSHGSMFRMTGPSIFGWIAVAFAGKALLGGSGAEDVAVG